jgi:hypothetical protein
MSSSDRIVSKFGLLVRPCRVELWVFGLLAAVLSTAQMAAGEPLIERGAEGWRYCQSPTIECEGWQSDRWTAVEFDDATWPQGKAILGYGDPDVATELSFGVNPQLKESSALFRHRFALARNPAVRLLRGRVCCDDGVVVFLNGREVFRYNLPSGTLSHGSRALRAIGPAAEDERRYHPFVVPADVLADGENVVAVSVHQVNATSSDLAMDLELTALTSEQEVEQARQEAHRETERDEEVEAISGQVAPVVRFEISGESSGSD